MIDLEKFKALGINIPANKLKPSGWIYIPCPQCGPRRKKPDEPSLGINLDKGYYHCHNQPECNFRGSVNSNNNLVTVYMEAKMPSGPEYDKGKFSEAFLSYWEKRGILEETLRRAHVWEKQQYHDGLPKGRTAPVACFPIYWNMELVNVKYRYILKKGFYQISREKGSLSVFMGLETMQGLFLDPPVIDKEEPLNDVIICEGEVDRLTYIQAGFKHVLSVPQGATKSYDYIDYCQNILKPVKKFYLAVDDDEAGRGLLDELARRLGKERCMIVRYPKGCKDANDIIRIDDKAQFPELTPAQRLEKVKETIERAKMYPVRGIILLTQVTSELDDIYVSGFQPGYRAGNPWDKFVTFKRGNLIVLTGVPATGKSHILQQIATGITENYPEEKMKWGLFQPEEGSPQEIYAMLIEKKLRMPITPNYKHRATKQQFMEARMWVHEHFKVIAPPNPFQYYFGDKKPDSDSKAPNSVDGILNLAKVLVEQAGIQGLILDNWSKFDHIRPRTFSETEYIGHSIDKFLAFSRYYNVMIFLAAHPSKVEVHEKTGNFKELNMYSVSGSAHWNNKADLGIILNRKLFEMKDGVAKENFRQPTDVRIAKLRKWYLGKLGSFSMWMDTHKGNTFVDDPDLLTEPLYVPPKITSEADRPEPMTVPAGEEDLFPFE